MKEAHFEFILQNVYSYVTAVWAGIDCGLDGWGLTLAGQKKKCKYSPASRQAVGPTQWLFPQA
jgi:hypothetical protein